MAQYAATMQEEIENSSPRSAHDFAGLLAALAAATPSELPAWNDEELPQDVATLTYERTLRKHARYMPGETEGISTARTYEAQSRHPSPATQTETQDSLDDRGPQMQAYTPVPVTDRDRKCASVTIRMSQAECEQLRERASEAGLTISAYVRSCTFEAEALRAQVKQALAELRSAHAPETKPATDQGKQRTAASSESGLNSLAPGARLGWLRRMIPDLHPARNLARV